MKRQNDEKRLFTKRVFAFLFINLLLGIVILSRLCYLQIFKGSHYALLSDKNRIVTKQILPYRGKILDSSGKLLAGTRFSYSVTLDLLEIPSSDRETVIKLIIKTKSLDEKTINELLNVPEKINRSNRFILLKEDLDWETLAEYYIFSSTIPGIIIEKTPTRHYLYSKELAHVIGYIGTPNKEEIQRSENTSLFLPMAKIGKTAIEKQYDNELFGKSGIQQIEVNSRRQFVRSIDNIDSSSGKDINLTIHLELQLEVYNILSQYESSSCVVMDVNSGAILALVSYPGYDINIFTKKIDANELKEIYNNPYNPIINKVISGLYSPGSAFKMITGIAGLDSGVINKHSMVNCCGFTEIGSHKFHCWKWKYGGHGSVNLEDSISESCDVYFYNIARILSSDIIAKTANDFGLGKITGIDLPNEKSGLIPTKNWKKKIKKQSWTKGDTFNMSIGQGFVLTTPLQLARMVAMLVNGLKPITPHIRKYKNEEITEKLKYKKEHIDIILDGMYDVVNSQNGTARMSSLDDEDFEFSGKTGSSQVFRITESQRKLGKTVSDDYWKKEHAVFVGYAPSDTPKLAICVLVEHGGGGAKTAAPIARDVFLACKKYIKH